MDLLLFKTREQILQDGIARLEQSELNIQGSSGKIARLLLNIVNSMLADDEGVYDTLRTNHVRAFLSTADGEALDSIGYMLNCSRIIGELDGEYRYRISQQTLSMEKANETAIRLAALSTSNVQDIIMKPFVYGTGSFSIYVISNQPVTPQETLDLVKKNVYLVAGYGIRFEVLRPDIIEIMMNILVSFSPKATEIDKTVLLANAKTAVMTHLNGKKAGETLVISEIESLIKGINELVSSVNITSIRVNEKLVFTKDQECRWNQRFITSSVPDAITLQAV